MEGKWRGGGNGGGGVRERITRVFGAALGSSNTHTPFQLKMIVSLKMLYSSAIKIIPPLGYILMYSLHPSGTFSRRGKKKKKKKKKKKNLFE